MSTVTNMHRILRLLNMFRSAGGGPLSSLAIWQELTLPGQPQMTKGDFDTAFRELEDGGLIIGITPQIGHALYAISDRGAIIAADHR